MRSGLAAAALLVGVTGCGASASRGALATLRPACAADQYWSGTACAPRGDGAAKVEAGKEALAKLDFDAAKVALAAADRGGPLDHAANITLWEQRGIAAAYGGDEPGARAAFDMLLALDPGHFLSYTLAPKATFVFEKVRDEQRAHGAPALDVNWEHGQRVGAPVPLDVEVIADPKSFLHRATVFVRARGESAWRAADLALAPGDRRILLPAVRAEKPVSLELYLRAYDDKDNEVLAWADPQRPREIPLRYDPPQPWYRTWWVITIGASALAIGTGVAVYELTLAPGDKATGGVSVH